MPIGRRSGRMATIFKKIIYCLLKLAIWITGNGRTSSFLINNKENKYTEQSKKG